MISQAAKYLFPIGATALCMSHTVFAAEKKTNPACVYDEPKKESCGCSTLKNESKETELERFVMKCRQDLGPLQDSVKSYTSVASCHANNTYNTIIENVNYLRTGAPDEVRIGTIVAGGLVGMLLGFRKGLFKKLVYGGLGATGASYVVYPKETVYYGRNGYSIAQKNLAIAYNFVIGVEPQDKLPNDANRGQ